VEQRTAEYSKTKVQLMEKSNEAQDLASRIKSMTALLDQNSLSEGDLKRQIEEF
jgi:hypothetical protein